MAVFGSPHVPEPASDHGAYVPEPASDHGAYVRAVVIGHAPNGAKKTSHPPAGGFGFFLPLSVIQTCRQRVVVNALAVAQVEAGEEGQAPSDVHRHALPRDAVAVAHVKHPQTPQAPAR